MSFLALKLLSLIKGKPGDISKFKYKGPSIWGTMLTFLDTTTTGAYTEKNEYTPNMKANQPMSIGQENDYSYEPNARYFDIKFKSDGTKAFILNSRANDDSDATPHMIQPLTLASPYVLSGERNAVTQYESCTQGFDDDNSNIVGNANSREFDGFTFKPDGTSFWFMNGYTGELNEVQLSTAYDLSTVGSYTTPYREVSLGNPGNGYFCYAFWNNDGTKLFCINRSGQQAREYSVSSAYDITSTLGTTSTIDLVSLVSGASLYVYSACFADSGNKLLIYDAHSDGLIQFTMSSAYTFAGLGGATYSTAVANDSRGAFYNNDGTKLYVSDNNGGYSGKGLNTHTLTSAYDLSTIQSSSSIFYIRQYDLGASGFNPRNLELANSGQYLFVKLYGNNSSHGKPCYIARLNFGPNTYGDTGDLAIGLPLYKDAGGDTAYGFTFSADGTKLYNVDAANGINYFTLGTAWDVYTASFVSSNSIFTASDHCYITFKPDGTKLFRADSSGNLSEYALSTPYVTTSGVTQTSNTNITGESFYSIDFNSDGTKLFLIEENDNFVAVTLSGAYDFTNIATQYSGSKVVTDLGPTGQRYWYGGGVSGDGKWYSGTGNLYGDAWIGPYGFEINSSTGAMDLSHWSLAISTDGQGTSPDTNAVKSFEWADSGTKLFVFNFNSSTQSNANRTARFDASTAYDIGTLSYVHNTNSIGAFGSAVRVRLSATGNRLFISSSSSPKRVYQYNLSSNFDLTSTITQSTNFDIDTGTNSVISDFRWKSDGAMLYILDGGTSKGPKIFQYTADTAFTADNNMSSTPTHTLDLSTQFEVASNAATAVRAMPKSFCFNSNGSKLYVFHDESPDAPKGLAAADGGFSVNGFQYDLTTPWSIDTASFSGKVLPFSSPLGRITIADCFMTNAGTKTDKQLHVMGNVYRERANSVDKFTNEILIKFTI